MSAEKILSDLKNKKFKPVYWLEGDEPYFIDEIMNFAYYQVCNIAANNDYYDLLKYAHIYGCPWNEDTTANAAAEGNLYCLMFLHENGCPWDERTCALSMANGHVSCLHYARTNGAPE